MRHMASDTTKHVNEIITTCLDGKYGYEQAAANAGDASLKTLFTDYAQQRGSFATELQSAVRAAGGEPTDSSSVTAAFHRGWIGLKDKVTGGDKGILGECIRGEEHAVKAYSKALQEDDVAPQVKTVLAKQHGEVEQALANMNSLHSAQ